MRFLVDAQLPRRLIHPLREAGHDAIHTLDLPEKNQTTDDAIGDLTLRDGLVLITKDADFVVDFVLRRRPYKLLLVSTGNINNDDLEDLFVSRIAELASLFETHDFIEMDRARIVIHV